MCPPRRWVPPANQWGGAPELSRYYQPEESRPYLWLSPAIRWPEALAGTREGKVRVVIVEGEKKAEKICRDGKGEVVAIGLGGVWNTGSKRQRIEVIPKGAPVADGSSRVPAVHKEVVGQSIRELGEGLPFLAGASRSDILPLMSAWYNVNASSSRSVNGVPTEPSAA